MKALYWEKEDGFILLYYLQTMLNNTDAIKEAAQMSNGSVTAANVFIEGMRMTMTVIATGPIVLLYPFVQHYFVKGLTIGAVKG